MAELAPPPYDRRSLTVGIVHIGPGSFHRAHEAVYLDRLLRRDEAHDWGICELGLLESDRAIRDALLAQDYQYTLVEKHADGRYTADTIGSIIDYVYAPDEPDTALARLTAPSTRIVSLTITEGGYSVDDATGEFVGDGPGIVHDTEPCAVPRTWLGFVAEALRRRRSASIPPFTIMSCDNLPGNGKVARTALLGFARMRDPELAEWIQERVCFPDSMVDRITPKATADDRQMVASRFGVKDRSPVVCEPYAEWVLEDSFSAGRPSLEHVGVRLVDDVKPYELLKLRLLNASHQALCYFARLLGLEYVDQAIADPGIREFVLSYMRDAGATLTGISATEIETYEQIVIERFANPEIRDTVARISEDGSDRIPKFVVPVLRDQLARSAPITHSAAVIASWARYLEGVDDAGNAMTITDRRSLRLMRLAQHQSTDLTALLAARDFVAELGDNETFVASYASTLRSLRECGARATLMSLTK